jgi:hypothetical protein
MSFIYSDINSKTYVDVEVNATTPLIGAPISSASLALITTWTPQPWLSMNYHKKSKGPYGEKINKKHTPARVLVVGLENSFGSRPAANSVIELLVAFMFANS